jgi:hypothetical protein
MKKLLLVLASYVLGAFCAFQYGRAYERAHPPSLGEVPNGKLSVKLVDATGAELQPRQDSPWRDDSPEGLRVTLNNTPMGVLTVGVATKVPPRVRDGDMATIPIDSQTGAVWARCLPEAAR